jgi:hypothetical protein
VPAFVTRPLGRIRAARSLGPILFLLVAAAVAPACGKKGPPLPPLPRVAVAPADVVVQRTGDEVVIDFTVPTANVDGRKPADLDRVEVHALTGPPRGQADFLKKSTVVGSVPVRRPPPEPEPAEEGKPEPPPPPPSTEPGLDQGARARIVETLTPAAHEPVPLDDEEEARATETKEPRVTPPDLGPPLPALPTRFYVVMGMNGGRKGTATPRIPVPLYAAPAPPAAPTAAVTEGKIALAWTPPAGGRRPFQRQTMAAPIAAPPGPAPGAPRVPGPPAGAMPPALASPAPAAPAPPAAALPVPASATEAPATPAAAPAADAAPPPVLRSRSLIGLPSFTTRYHVYEVAPPGEEQPKLEPGALPPFPRRLTTAPLAMPSYDDPRVEFGVERCYVVRTVETLGAMSVESPPSERLCVTPADAFPPAAPKALAAVASEGAIGLIWEANTEADLAGYVVLRGEAPGDTLQPLTPQPIKETTFRDTTVKPGIRYVYAVVAVDNATPQNVSAQSNRVEETAR